MNGYSIEDSHRIQQRAVQYRQRYPQFANWAKGRGVIEHTDLTQVRVFDLCQELVCAGRYDSLDDALIIFEAADTLTNAAMWLVAHMTYASRVDLSGQPLAADDFKENPQGHTGGSLNMVPAYLGYITANTLAGLTRSWLMGQGHCVAAIESVNILLGNLHPEQQDRYTLDEAGLSRLGSDFYSYAVTPDGTPGVPLGSHVNPHTAGGLIEGGYLGFAELQYTHMPLHLGAGAAGGSRRNGDAAASPALAASVHCPCTACAAGASPWRATVSCASSVAVRGSTGVSSHAAYIPRGR